ncbi:alcohol dehydrogenase catalytic domain-containing protein [Sediminibacillus dalangtanensis]|uniref:Alcohol dehydrogenase catalytic domain-containing protein n=1 Tax=Sediminibacillus dalangtanensis TaxID=2729421 RepID=A0ABX7VUF4_9BACI|nr:zinc-dependent alcohol dehydrogenase [Sediminibacillus dalangtanensis]QTN00597.1 alcohol dehydrogenase catalytic domain-containing protein [Sediminibacillus dalangtanensis]
MKAVTNQGKQKVEVKNVADPSITTGDDMIVRITSTAICGSDLHLYHGHIPLGDDYVIGHEPMGIVEEVGPDVKKVKKGDRVVIPFNVSCGECHFCKNQMESQCDNSNPHRDTGAYFGYSEMYGNYPGGQAEYLRVPYADFSSFVVPESSELEDESLLFLSDIIPTAYWSVVGSGVKEGDTVIVLGSGPVGLLTQKFAWLQGAKRVIAVDHVPYRLEHAKRTNNVEVYNFEEFTDMGGHLHEITRGGAEVVIDCVGMDGKVTMKDHVKTLAGQVGTIDPIITAAHSVKKFGTIQLTGVYGAPATAYPMNSIFSRNITVKAGQAPVIHFMPELYDMVEKGVFDPTDIITHKVGLDDAAESYRIFDKKEDDCIKVVLKP